MNVLGLEPYYGGSHQAFLDGWVQHSQHSWELLTLSASNWRWRMRHAPVTFSERVATCQPQGATWDMVFCSDMLDLAQFVGLAPEIAHLPRIIFFHENQLIYPTDDANSRDYHCAFTNFTSCLAADSVWFNSAFHRDGFLEALRLFLRRMPNHRHLSRVDDIAAKSQVQSLGIAPFERPSATRRPGPLRIVWAARWEFDKRPDLLFGALDQLMQRGIAFEISVLGGTDRQESAPLFQEARQRLGDRVQAWGYVDSSAAYALTLGDADVVLSTADHEFFGLSVIEAVAAGAYPVVPNQLAYPEVLRNLRHLPHAFHNNTIDDISDKLCAVATALENETLWGGDRWAGCKAVDLYSWEQRAPALDDALNAVKR
jgi:glycosyltransferase involved in cell wall biosynthesis